MREIKKENGGSHKSIDDEGLRGQYSHKRAAGRLRAQGVSHGNQATFPPGSHTTLILPQLHHRNQQHLNELFLLPKTQQILCIIRLMGNNPSCESF